MRILLNNNHTPHQAMLLKAMPDQHFHVLEWNTSFRECPSNATLISKRQAKGQSWDLVLDDDAKAAPTMDLRAKRRVFLHHCEHDGGNAENVASLSWVFENFDIVAVPSKHKIASMREKGLSPNVVELPFGFEAWNLPRQHRDPGLVGCFHNSPNSEIRDFWSSCVSGFRSVMIGPVASGSFPVRLTRGFNSFEDEASRVGIYLNCVVGEAMGMSPLEAMTAGIPVITGCAPEPWEFIFNGWNGFLSRNEPMKSIDWIREKIRYLIENPEIAEAMGNAGRATVLSRFPMSRVQKVFTSFLTDL